MHSLVLSVISVPLSICRLDPGCAIPAWATKGRLFSITRTADELSIVCEEGLAPADARQETGWRALKVEGPLDFSLTGILARLATVLAQAEISLFAISTFDTDYILVRQGQLDAAVDALRDAGYFVGMYNKP